MDKELYDLHLKAGLVSGQKKTCGKKRRFASEALAKEAADALSSWENRTHDVEPYPCAFCSNWHIGGIMPIAVMEAMIASSPEPADEP